MVGGIPASGISSKLGPMQELACSIVPEKNGRNLLRAPSYSLNHDDRDPCRSHFWIIPMFGSQGLRKTLGLLRNLIQEELLAFTALDRPLLGS